MAFFGPKFSPAERQASCLHPTTFPFSCRMTDGHHLELVSPGKTKTWHHYTQKQLPGRCCAVTAMTVTLFLAQPSLGVEGAVSPFEDPDVNISIAVLCEQE